MSYSQQDIDFYVAKITAAQPAGYPYGIELVPTPNDQPAGGPSIEKPGSHTRTVPVTRGGQMRDLYGVQAFGPSLHDLRPATISGHTISSPLAGGATRAGLNPCYRLGTLEQDANASGSPGFMSGEPEVVVQRRRTIERQADASDPEGYTRKSLPWARSGGATRTLTLSPVSGPGFTDDWGAGASHIHSHSVPTVLVSTEFGRYHAVFVSAAATADSFNAKKVLFGDRRP